ncbi:neuraminidase-like domain-containing protein [Pseudomonas frederiksbergensis]|uniref:Tc toxin subunit A-related protein n=1 Tax=Pseudomonas frederiksbergensis TaxID=104087 RepID=UPI003D1AF578
MDNNKLAGLLEQRRTALVEYCIGQVKPDSQYNFVKTPADLFELLRMDPLDNYPVQSSWVAEATSCAQNYIHAVYRKLEPGYSTHEFDKDELKLWELFSNYPDWAALQMIALYPENYINPYVRQRKTSLFKNLENNLNQTRLSIDAVLLALRDYLQVFEQTCNLDVISCYMDGLSPSRADYYMVGRQRVQPFQYFWRKAEIEITASCRAINPAAWGEWQPIEVPVGGTVLDVRPVFWGGRLCLVWAEWRDKVVGTNDVVLPNKLDINLAFMAQNGHWSAPLSLHSVEISRDVSPGSRLIATVFVDDQHPKGKLAVLLTNRKSGTSPEVSVDIYDARDVLFRKIDDDKMAMDALADDRFVNPEIVQHPMVPEGAPDITDSVEIAGTLTDLYSLQAVVWRVINETSQREDVLLVRGLCAAKAPGGVPANSTFDLTFPLSTENDPKEISGSFSNAGGWSTGWLVVRRTAGGFTAPYKFTFGGSDTTDGYGRKEFTVSVNAVTAFIPPSLDKSNAQGAQFLTLNQLELDLKYVRLNSLFGPELVQRANISVDAVLDWSTQFLEEPGPTTGDIDEPNGAFNGANGLFFWELFFHLPHLVASRLSAENRFLEAQQWLHYLFDPQAPVDPKNPPKPRYWRCRPLTSAGNLGCETQTPTDPDAIGYSVPRHFRIVAYIEYVKNLMAWGDWYYRQLTRDSLVAAKLCYVQADFLMGKAPTGRAVNDWQTTTLGELLEAASTRPALEQFENNLDFTLADLPASAPSMPALGMLAVEPFNVPINEQLLDLYALPGRRLQNLRNNLTLDGKPMDIPLFSPPTDPNQLLRDLAAGGTGSPRPMGGQLVVVAFRWRVMFEAAMRAVQTLQEYGNQVLRLLEQRDRAEVEELQHNHLVELGAYAQTVQEKTITQMQASVTALEQSKAAAQERADAYALRYERNVSDVEYDVMAQILQAKQMSLASNAIKGGGAVIASLPNIFGMANGGHRGEELANAIVYGLELASSALLMDAEKSSTAEAYRRRREEWALQRDQARAEVRMIDEQLIAQRYAVDAANASLAQTLRANSQALTLYTFMKKRATNAELFGWLLGQLKALHYQAYDAVVGLCISAQTALSAETGDYDSQIPLPQVWLDNRHGLTAGEHLRGYLLRMEREYLHRHERRLELVKTISLRQLFDDGRQVGFDSWQRALDSLQDTGTLEFGLTQLLFDRDHPGHYCRQISSVEVDLPVLTGPYENVKATLLQVSSTTATKATARSVEYLYASGNAVAPVDVRFNLRSGQQIALSMGIADTGMAAMKPDEGLLNPFECTGAVSRWTLNFPWPGRQPQKAMLASLTDIIVRVRYTARVGDSTFTRKVEELVKSVVPDEPTALDESPTHAAKTNGQGSSQS